MANGIATPKLVVEMARAGMLSFFGAAGLSPERVEAGVDEIRRSLGGDDRLAWGANLIHSPAEPRLEERVTELYLAKGVRRVEASAFMGLTPSVVRYAASGLHIDAHGEIGRRHRMMAKVSRPEIARQFLEPAPEDILGELVNAGHLSEGEARLASRVSVATDLTVEADSGGHTDNRPLSALFPTIKRLKDEIGADVHVGAAGGLGTPAAVAAAFALGADYVLTGSLNQASVESGLSDLGKEMLASADVADVAMAAAADMFEMGVRVQVLKRGTMFSLRANRLYEVFRSHSSLDELPASLRHELEERVLGASIDAVWHETETFWRERDPAQLDRASVDPKHKMALVFRWYLGMSSRWAIAGNGARRADYQIWCGPAMGAFNAWVKGSFLEPPAARSVVQIALNLLEGAAIVVRAQQLRTYGVPVPSAAFDCRPRKLRVQPA
jgi:PfaD family protein